MGNEKESLPSHRVPLRTQAERVLRLLLVVVATGLACFTCFLFAIPHFPAGVRPGGNESAAIATMKNIAIAQARFQSSALLDRDGDGVGEYGYFAELTKGDQNNPPRLSMAFSRTRLLPNGGGVIRRSGYIFQMFLPAADGKGMPETNPVTRLPDPDQSEKKWCCYAWPAAYLNTGKRVFFVDQNGIVSWTTNRRQHYTGTQKAPAFDAAFGRDACGTGLDGQVWQPLR